MTHKHPIMTSSNKKALRTFRNFFIKYKFFVYCMICSDRINFITLPVRSIVFLTHPPSQNRKIPSEHVTQYIKTLFWAKNRPFGPINFLTPLVSSIIFCTTLILDPIIFRTHPQSGSMSCKIKKLSIRVKSFNHNL